MKIMVIKPFVNILILEADREPTLKEKKRY